jgi:curved DNA-binding protein CbpA
MGAEPRRPASGTSADDPFAVLGVGVAADDAAVRDAYRSALRAHPPERDPEAFKRVRAAYEALRDARARARAAVLRHPWLDDLAPPSPEELGAVRPGPPDPAWVRAELERLALAGTDLGRTDFAADLRPPRRPPWADA